MKGHGLRPHPCPLPQGEGGRLPNPDVLQAILTRMEWFEREQMFLVRQGGQESKGAEVQKCKGADGQKKEVKA